MIAAIYARKSTEQNGVADEQKSVARRMSLAGVLACVVAAVSLSAGYAQAQTSKTGRPPLAGWSVTTNTDPMSDAKTKTLLLRSADGRASLRVNCNDAGKYVILFTAPKGIQVTNPTMLELRFDGDQSAAYLIETLDIVSLVASLGGSKSDQNYAVGTATGGEKLQNAQIVGAANRDYDEDANCQQIDLSVAARIRSNSGSRR